jgi:tetratricopeptide (TPR) repeat protein
MKKQIVAIAVALLSLATFAQKEELKIAQKAINKGDFAGANIAVKSLDAMLANMEDKYKTKYYFLKGQTLSGENKYADAAETFNTLFAFEKKIGKTKYTKLAKPILDALIQKVSNKALAFYNDDKNYKLAAENFYLTYKLYPTDTTTLYNAALSASLAKEYAAALTYYSKLKELGYTGIVTEYLATNVESGEEENLGSKLQRNLMVKTGGYNTPLDKVSESKQAEIIKNIGYIYVNQGKPQLAIEALEEARKANPKDINLLLNQAQMYIKLERMDKFGELMIEAVTLDPTNPTLFFNLGVVNANQDKTKEAIGFYKKAIELDPNYGDAYMNLSLSILSSEKAIIDEMNINLSNNTKYEALEQDQKNLYKEALPYLLEADRLKRSLGSVRTLLNIYDTLEMTSEADALRPVYKKLRNQ